MARIDTRSRGLSSEQEVHQASVHKDVRGFFPRAAEFLRIRNNMAAAIGSVAALIFIIPAIGDYLFLFSLLLAYWGVRQAEDVPLKFPIQAKYADPKNINPKTKAPDPGIGIFYFGNERRSGKELWLTNDDVRQHMLVIGTTGAGKTEALIGFVANALTWSSGFLFCDGKGDVALFAKIYALARLFGREDDILVLNFMTGNRDLGKMRGNIMSNTMNPFATGSSDSLTQMVVALMDDAGGDGAMWKGRATAMFTGVMRALTWLRDQDKLDLDVSAIRDFIGLRAIIDLANPNGDYKDMPPDIRHSVRSYLTSLPGFVEEKGHKQAQTTLDQHGYLEMQFTKILGSLADVYGHIFSTEFGEVDMFDVVINRRILVIMLPALEKAGDEIANLGKIVVANLKGMMGSTLGSAIQGTWKDIVLKRVTTSPSPFLVCLDEVGYYTVDGMALMCAQARSLGFGLILASQDIPAMKRLNEKEADSIIANTNTKIFMRLEEMEKSGGLAVASAGKGLQNRSGGFSGRVNEVGVSWNDKMDASLVEIDRVNTRDLRRQSAGEMTVMHQDYVIEGISFYAAPDRAVDVRKFLLGTNHFVKVRKPKLAEIQQADRLPQVLSNILDPSFARQMVAEQKAVTARMQSPAGKNEEFSVMSLGYDSYLASKKNCPNTEAACASFVNALRVSEGLLNSFGEQLKSRMGGEVSFDPSDLSADDYAPPSRTSMDDYQDSDNNPYLSQLIVDSSSDGDEYPLPMADDSEDDIPKSIIVPVDHSIEISGRGVISDFNQDNASNDSILRVLADLDYHPEQSVEDIERSLKNDIGGHDLSGGMADADILDNAAYQSQKVREVGDSPEGEPNYVSEMLGLILDDDD